MLVKKNALEIQTSLIVNAKEGSGNGRNPSSKPRSVIVRRRSGNTYVLAETRASSLVNTNHAMNAAEITSIGFSNTGKVIHCCLRLNSIGMDTYQRVNQLILDF